jgi:hypothetical protein
MSSFDADLKVLAKKLYNLASVEGPRAVSSALNKTAALIQTQVVKEVAKEAKIPQKIIRKKAFIRRSTAKKQRTTISLYRTGVPLITLAGGKGAVQEPAPGWISVKGFFVQRGFINRVRKTGKNQVFQRKNRLRYPIDVVRVNIHQIVDASMPKHTAQKMRDDFPRLLKRDLEYRITRYGG